MRLPVFTFIAALSMIACGDDVVVDAGGDAAVDAARLDAFMDAPDAATLDAAFDGIVSSDVPALDANSMDSAVLDGAVEDAPFVPTPAPYDFESLSTNGLLDGRDGWVDRPGSGDAVTSMDEGTNGTIVVETLPTVALNGWAHLTRANDGVWSFNPFLGSETNAVMRFDASGQNLSLLGVGTDVSADGSVRFEDNEIGFAFGCDDQNFIIRSAAGVESTIPFGDGNSRSDWYRFELRVNLVAGTASMAYQNLSDADETPISIAGLTDIDLELEGLDAGASPPLWDAVYVELLAGGGNIPAADNLWPNAPAL